MNNREQLLSLYGKELTFSDFEMLYSLFKAIEPDDVQGIDEHRQMIELLAQFRRLIEITDKYKGEKFVETIQSLLSVGQDGIYSDPLRFFFELIQNVDDCQYSDPSNVKLHVVFIGNVISLQYNENGFTPFNVFAITGIAEAAKNLDDSKVEIGEKGLGFKSVFGIAESVLIQSGMFSFRLNQDHYTIPIPEYDGYTPVKGTRLTLVLKDEAAVQNICYLIKERYCTPNAIFKQNPMLFLNKMTELELLVDNASKRLSFTAERKQRQYLNEHLEVERNVEIKASLHPLKEGAEPGEFDETIVADRYTLTTVYNTAMCISRYGAKTKLREKKMHIQVIYPTLQHLTDSSAITSGSLYSFLPTQIGINAPIIIHAPFKLDGSREYVDSQNSNAWFSHTLNQLMLLLRESYADMAQHVYESILYYLPKKSHYIFKAYNNENHCLRTYELTGRALLTGKLFYGSDQKFHTRAEVMAYAGNLPVDEQQRIHTALGEATPLFIMPSGLVAEHYEIPVLSDPYYKLLLCAFQSSAIMKNALPIIDALIESKGAIELIQRLDAYHKEYQSGKIKLTYMHFHLMAQYDNFADAFSKWMQRKVLTVYPFDFEMAATTYDITTLNDTHFDISDVGGNMRNYLLRIDRKCILVSGDHICVPLKEALIISKDKALDLFADFCKLMDKNSHFDITLKLMAMSKQLNDAESTQSAIDYLHLLKDVRTNGKVTLGQSYGSYIKLLHQASPNPARFLNELLQNADDCKYPEGVIPTIAIKTAGQRFTIEYNETGFDKHNVRAITAIGESTKKRLLSGVQLSQDSIGEKGIGFKSVFSVAKYVEIHSNGFHFRLSDDAPTIPVLDVEEKHQNEPGTFMELALKSILPAHLGSKDNLLSLCLCLRRIRRIMWNSMLITIEDNNDKRIITIDGEKHEYAVYSHTFTVSDNQALNERRQGNRDISPKQEIRCYIPVQFQRKAEFFLYSGLPTKIRINIPMYIDAPFELTTARDNVLDNSWNRIIRSHVYQAIYGYTSTEREILGIRSLRYVAVKMEANSYKNNTFEANTFMNSVSLKDCALHNVYVPVVNGELCQVYLTRKYPAFIRRMIESAFADRPEATTTLDYSDDEYNAAYFFLNGQDAKQEHIFSVLSSTKLNEMLPDEMFRRQLYAYLEPLKGSNMQIQQLRIIPVWDSFPGQIRYVAYNDKPIYREQGVNVSKSKDYWVLNEQMMSATQFVAITKATIDTMDYDHAVQIYKKKLMDKIKSNPSAGMNLKSQVVYAYLIQQCSSTPMLIEALKTMTSEEQKYLVLKNCAGEIVDSHRVFILQPGCSVFGNMLQHYIVSKECEVMAKALGRPSIEEIQYSDVEDYEGILNAEDLEDLLASEHPHFRYGRSIARDFYDQGKIEPTAAEAHGLGFFSAPKAQTNNWEFPRDSVKNLLQCREDAKVRIGKAPVTTSQVEELMVRGCIDPRTGKFVKIDHKKVRDEQTYTSRAHEDGQYCFCQMCEEAKHRDYIEVTSIQHEPPIYLPAAYLSLCLECSKRYRGLTASASSGFTRSLYQQILKTKVLGIGKVVVDVEDYKVRLRFTDAHFVQIQTFVQSLQSSNDYVPQQTKASVPAAHAKLQEFRPVASTINTGSKSIPPNSGELENVGDLYILGAEGGSYALMVFSGKLRNHTSNTVDNRYLRITHAGKTRLVGVHVVKAESRIYIPRNSYNQYGQALHEAPRLELLKS